jgi:hypothetical protein
MCMSDPATTRAPGRYRPTRLALVLVAGVVLAVLAAILVKVSSGSGDDLTKGPEVPAIGTPTPPVCPVAFGENENAGSILPPYKQGKISLSRAVPLVTPANTRKGPLVPSGATESLLCSYRFAAPAPMPLTATHRITSGADEVVKYLNGLPTSRPKGEMCGLNGTTAHVMVFGYANRPAAVVYARGCAWDQAGAVRYGGDLRKVTGF